MTRLERYAALEKHRKRPLIVYATSTRENVQANIAGDAVREFIDQLDALPKDARKVDILLHSAGGDPLAAWKIMTVMRERFDDVAVLVPYMAFSAATLLSLGANQIVMHPHASLGPIDPQITVQRDGRELRFAYEDVGAFLRFLKKEVGLTEQTYVAEIVDKLFKTVDPLSVGFAQRASELSTDVGERLLRLHTTDGEKPGEARTIAERMNKAFFAHGDAVSRRRARELGLKIAPDEPELEKLMWDAFLAVEEEMSLRTPFQPLELFMADKSAASSLNPPAALQLPPNTPAQMAQQVWDAVLNGALSRAQSAPTVAFSQVLSIVESAYKQRSFVLEGTISVVRVGLELKAALTTTSRGWRG